MPQQSDILGYINVTQALGMHKTHQKGKYISDQSQSPDPDPGPGSGSVFNFESFLQIIKDNDNGSSDDSSGIVGEAEDDDDDDGDDSDKSSVHEDAVIRKPGERYTGIHFEFLKEDWLDPVNGSLADSSEDCSSSSDD
jgi:hypothetical protein